MYNLRLWIKTVNPFKNVLLKTETGPSPKNFAIRTSNGNKQEVRQFEYIGVPVAEDGRGTRSLPNPSKQKQLLLAKYATMSESSAEKLWAFTAVSE